MGDQSYKFAEAEIATHAKELKATLEATLSERHARQVRTADTLASLGMLRETVLSMQPRMPVMVPMGTLAFVPGELLDPSVFYVKLGSDFVFERTAAQTAAMLARRETAAQQEADDEAAAVREVVADYERDIGQLFDQLDASRTVYADRASGAVVRRIEGDFMEIREPLPDECPSPAAAGAGAAAKGGKGPSKGPRAGSSGNAAPAAAATARGSLAGESIAQLRQRELARMEALYAHLEAAGIDDWPEEERDAAVAEAVAKDDEMDRIYAAMRRLGYQGAPPAAQQPEQSQREAVQSAAALERALSEERAEAAAAAAAAAAVKASDQGVWATDVGGPQTIGRRVVENLDPDEHAPAPERVALAMELEAERQALLPALEAEMRAVQAAGVDIHAVAAREAAPVLPRGAAMGQPSAAYLSAQREAEAAAAAAAATAALRRPEADSDDDCDADDEPDASSGPPMSLFRRQMLAKRGGGGGGGGMAPRRG